MYMPVGHKQAHENVCRAIPIGHRRPNPAQGGGGGTRFLTLSPTAKTATPPPRCSDFAEGGGYFCTVSGTTVKIWTEIRFLNLENPIFSRACGAKTH